MEKEYLHQCAFDSIHHYFSQLCNDPHLGQLKTIRFRKKMRRVLFKQKVASNQFSVKCIIQCFQFSQKQHIISPTHWFYYIPLYLAVGFTHGCKSSLKRSPTICLSEGCKTRNKSKSSSQELPHQCPYIVNQRFSKYCN